MPMRPLFTLSTAPDPKEPGRFKVKAFRSPTAISPTLAGTVVPTSSRSRATFVSRLRDRYLRLYGSTIKSPPPDHVWSGLDAQLAALAAPAVPEVTKDVTTDGGDEVISDVTADVTAATGDPPNALARERALYSDLDRRPVVIPPKPGPPPEPDPAPEAPPAAGVPADDDALLAKIRLSKQGPKFAALYDRGELNGYAGDPSRADLSLCCILAYWTQRNPERIDRLFRRSALYRGRWENRREDSTYEARTVAKAVEITTQVYRPDPPARPPARSRRQHEDQEHDQEPGEQADGADAGPAGEGSENRTAGKKKQKPAAADLIVNPAVAAGVRLFHTPEGEAFAQVPRGGHVEVHPVKSTAFRRFLAGLYFEVERKGVGGEVMATAAATLDALATFRGDEHPVYLRVAPNPGGGVAVDLCDADWRSVVVRPGGWEVVDCPPVMFRRSNTMLPLPAPERGGTLAELRAFLNLKDDDEWLVTASWLCAAVMPSGPYPVLHPKGEQGSSKSTFGRMLRRLFDPNKTDLRSQPREERDLAVASKHGWVIGYDNLSAIPVWL